MYRAIVLRGASLVGRTSLAVICGACGSSELPGPVCNPFVLLQSPCGFRSVTTTCSAGPAQCDGNTTASDLCEIGSPADPIKDDCSVSVILRDGSRHDFSVTIDHSAGAACVNALVSPSDNRSLTCTEEAGTDAASNPGDGGQDSSVDAATVDAGADAQGPTDAGTD